MKMWICDCSAAIENMLLASTDMGLGSLWVGIYPIESRMETMRKLLDIPDYVHPLGMIYLGHAENTKREDADIVRMGYSIRSMIPAVR